MWAFFLYLNLPEILLVVSYYLLLPIHFSVGYNVFFLFTTGPIVKGSAPIPPERQQRTGLESPKKRKLLPSFKIPAFKKSKGNDHPTFCVLWISNQKWLETLVLLFCYKPGCVGLIHSVISRSAGPSQQGWGAPVRCRWSPAGLETGPVQWTGHLLRAVLYRRWVLTDHAAAQGYKKWFGCHRNAFSCVTSSTFL